MATDDHKRLNQERYAASAELYVQSQIHATGMRFDEFIALAAPQPGQWALDVATGGGHVAVALAKRGVGVVALDLTETMLWAARAATEQPIRWCVGDAEAFPFVDNAFDLVICRVAAHHFADPFQFVREAARCLRPGGRLWVHDHLASDDEAIAEYMNAFERLRDPGHARELPEYEWRGNFLDAGFSVDHVETFPVRHELLPWARRQHCDGETIERLQLLMLRAPDAVRAWAMPAFAGTTHATFCNYAIFIGGSLHEQ